MTKKKTPLGGQASLPFPEVTGASAASALPERGSGGGDEGEKGSPVKGAENANTSDELAYVLTIEGNGHEAAALLEQAGVEVKSLRRVDQGADLDPGHGILLDFAATKWSCQTCGERVAFSGALTCSEECDRIRIHREVEDAPVREG